MEEKIFLERKTIYDGIREACDVTNDHGIFFNIPIRKEIFQKLQTAFVEYIHKCLESYYGDKLFLHDWRFAKKDFSLLNVYENEIFNLPNITPGGILKVKKEIDNEFNKIQSIVTDILIETGLINCISHGQYIVPRIKSGKVSLDERLRPMSTEKYHSDAWASQKGDAILSIPVGGDTTTTVEFCKPKGITKSFFNSLIDYDDAIEQVYFKELDFIDFAKFREINIFDHLCVHRTLKQNGGLRVSLEIGFAAVSEHSLIHESKNRIHESYRNEYVNQKDLRLLGKDIFVTTDETMKDAERYRKNPGQRQYAEIKLVRNKNV